jgi:hypothetical protein
VLDGYYAALVLNALHRHRVLEGLRNGVSARALARRMKWRLTVLEPLLEFLSCRTDVLVRRRPGSSYALSRQYHRYLDLGFLLDMYVGAYGRSVANVGKRGGVATWRRGPVDDGSLARAFEGAARAGAPLGAIVLASLGRRCIVDLGCGAGTLLCT